MHKKEFIFCINEALSTNKQIHDRLSMLDSVIYDFASAKTEHVNLFFKISSVCLLLNIL